MRITLFGKEILNISLNELEPKEEEKDIQVDPRIQSFIDAQEQKDREFKIGQSLYRENRDALIKNAKKVICPNVRKATKIDYLQWLNEFLNAGKQPTHYYSYPFSRWNNFYIALRSFEIIPLYGSASINIIVPEGIKITGNSGHTNLFLFEGHKSNLGMVPIFSDTKSFKYDHNCI